MHKNASECFISVYKNLAFSDRGTVLFRSSALGKGKAPPTGEGKAPHTHPLALAAWRFLSDPQPVRI